MRSRTRSCFLAATAAVALSACAPEHGAEFHAALAAAAREEGAGRFASAAKAYDRAANEGLLPADRDQARWAAAETTARAGNIAAAARRYAEIAGDDSDEHQAESTYRLALLRLDHGDAERGWSDLKEVARRFPTHGVAHVALRRIVGHADENGPQAGLDALRALEGDLRGTELEPLLAYLEAEHTERLGDTAGARAAYVAIADRWPYPFGAFFDDALWRASLLDEKLGQYADAVADLQRMLYQRETTIMVGSYERARYVPAILRIGALYRDRLHDRARARDAFHHLYADFAHSTSRDRGLWLEAALWREDGASDRACDTLRTLVSQFPDSRYVPCAVAQCAGLERPVPSKAPKECHPYITRGVRSDETDTDTESEVGDEAPEAGAQDAGASD